MKIEIWKTISAKLVKCDVTDKNDDSLSRLSSHARGLSTVNVDVEHLSFSFFACEHANIC